MVKGSAFCGLSLPWKENSRKGNSSPAELSPSGKQGETGFTGERIRQEAEKEPRGEILAIAKSRPLKNPFAGCRGARESFGADA